ncbi:serine protease inhibitor 28Dc-like [Condylostylus longicornis]|uniref:serine protease inhibitor 28Dc-like n=1 Tax=Condylostylus longicornis TaxID=2530218 RepID=UPI00244E48E7|nr:serine protease inhibitor 28Dc-like [Condylostylus longicornis]
MRQLYKLRNYFYILLIIAFLTCVESQRICRYKDRCITFPDEKELYQSQVPVFSPIPITTPLYRPQQSQQQQQFIFSQPSREEHQTLLQNNQPLQQTIREPIIPQYSHSDSTIINYDSPIAKNVSLSILHLAQQFSRHFQSNSLNGEQIFSPISIFSVLQLLLAGANGKTYNELNQFLSYHSDMGTSSYQEEFGKLIEDLILHETELKRHRPDAEWKTSVNKNEMQENREPKNVNDNTQKVKLANGIFIQNGYPLRSIYQRVVEEIYKSEIEALDFNQKENVVNYINNWVNQRTYGKIPSIVDKSGINRDTSMIMACAIYFKAFWEKPFISGGTMVNDFYPDGPAGPKIKVNMMANGGVFPYYDDPEYKIKVIGFPYKDGPTTMYIFQPYESTRERLRQMQELLTPEVIEYMISQMKKKTAVFVFPRLHVANSFNLKSTLSNMGLHSIFSVRTSDLSLISELVHQPFESQRNTESSRPIYKQTTGSPQLQDNSHFQHVVQPIYKQPNPTRGSDIIFLSRFGETESELNNTTEHILDANYVTPTPSTKEKSRKKRAVTYKVEREDKRKDQPLRFKDLVINKRITKLNKGKKTTRSRRQVSQITTPNNLLQYLDSIRTNQNLIRPDLYVDDIVHKVDLVVNEEGTEGAAATITYLRRSGTDIVFRADTPFLIILRHDQTKIPLFYGAIFEPSFN